MSDPQTQVPNVPLPPPPAPARRRRRPGVIVGGIVVVAALVAGSFVFVLTQGGGSAEARPLALAFTPGQSQTFAIHQTMDAHVSSDMLGDLPMQMEMDQVFTWKVVSVDEDGLATIEVTIDEMSGSLDGVEIPSAGDLPATQIVVAPDGRIVSLDGLPLGGMEQTQGFGFPGMGQLTPILPDGDVAVAPGDSWDKHFSQEFPFGEGTIEYTATSTYDRNETVDGREAAVILTDMTVPMEFTFDLQEALDALGELGATGPTGVDELRDATIAYSGGGDITQTSFVDLEAKELLRSKSTGSFDISMAMSGLAGFEGSMQLTGTFTQELELR